MLKFYFFFVIETNGLHVKISLTLLKENGYFTSCRASAIFTRSFSVRHFSSGTLHGYNKHMICGPEVWTHQTTVWSYMYMQRLWLGKNVNNVVQCKFTCNLNWIVFKDHFTHLLRKLRCSDCRIIPVFIMMVWKALRSNVHAWKRWRTQWRDCCRQDKQSPCRKDTLVSRRALIVAVRVQL